jgi:hypothetical protein
VAEEVLCLIYVKKPVERMINEYLWYSFERDVWCMRYTIDHWEDMKKVEYFSESWMTAEESPTPISEEKKTSSSHRRLSEQWGESIASIKDNEVF